MTIATLPRPRAQISEPRHEVVILRANTYSKAGRPITITRADLDRAVATFEADQAAGAAAPPIDYDHSHANARGSKAAGWKISSTTAERRSGEGSGAGLGRRGESLVGARSYGKTY